MAGANRNGRACSPHVHGDGRHCRWSDGPTGPMSGPPAPPPSWRWSRPVRSPGTGSHARTTDGRLPVERAERCGRARGSRARRRPKDHAECGVRTAHDRARPRTRCGSGARPAPEHLAQRLDGPPQRRAAGRACCPRGFPSPTSTRLKASRSYGRRRPAYGDATAAQQVPRQDLHHADGQASAPPPRFRV